MPGSDANFGLGFSCSMLSPILGFGRCHVRTCLHCLFGFSCLTLSSHLVFGVVMFELAVGFGFGYSCSVLLAVFGFQCCHAPSCHQSALLCVSVVNFGFGGVSCPNLLSILGWGFIVWHCRQFWISGLPCSSLLPMFGWSSLVRTCRRFWGCWMLPCSKLSSLQAPICLAGLHVSMYNMFRYNPLPPRQMFASIQPMLTMIVKRDRRHHMVSQHAEPRSPHSTNVWLTRTYVLVFPFVFITSCTLGLFVIQAVTLRAPTQNGTLKTMLGPIVTTPLNIYAVNTILKPVFDDGFEN